MLGCSIVRPIDNCINSNISMDRYHELSDATMDALLESLEVFIDGFGNPTFEVEYHVRMFPPSYHLIIECPGFTERRSYSSFGRQGNICDKQATPEQANMVVVAF